MPVQAGLDDDEARRVARLLKAIADPRRVRLLSMIGASDAGELSVCDLTGPLGLGQPTVSHHLKILVDAGFLTRRQRGTWAYYAPVPGALQEAAELLTHI